MSRLTSFFIYTAAFAIPPVIGAVTGFRALRERERPALQPRLDAAAAAAIPRPAIDPSRPTVVVVLGSDITEITDALGPYEMFARAQRYNVVTAAAERRPSLLTGGLRIMPHYSLAEIDARLGGAPAIVVVPNLPNAADASNRPVIDWLRRQALAGAFMHSWCKGAMALAETGLLDGKLATAHWGDIDALEKRYPGVKWVRGVRWVEHGQFNLSAGITSGIDASLRVLIRLAGDSVARRVARELRYPNYHYALDPTVEQYTLGASDLVLLANAAFRVGRPRVGVALYDGVGETDLSNVYDAHVHTMAVQVETVARVDGPVVTEHGLTVFPSMPLDRDGAASLRRLDRLMIPGIEARTGAAKLLAAITALAPELRAEYLHADDPSRFGLEPVLEDLARTAGATTARFAQRRMEYRSEGVQLDDRRSWGALGFAVALGVMGILALAGLRRLATRRVLATGVLVVMAAPAGAHAQTIEKLAPGTRVRADLFTAQESRLRRAFAQPLTGDLVGVRGDTLLLSVRTDTDPLRIPRSALRAAYVSRGRPNRFASGFRSALLPALAGAALRGAGATLRREEGGPLPAQAALSGAATAAAFAALKGAIFPKERWHRLAPWHSGPSPRRDVVSVTDIPRDR